MNDKGKGELDSVLKDGAVWQNRHGAKSGVEQKNKKN